MSRSPKSGELSVGSLGSTAVVCVCANQEYLTLGGVRPTFSVLQAQVDQMRSAFQATLDPPPLMRSVARNSGRIQPIISLLLPSLSAA